MATLFDQQIDLTYEGLIKTTDNAALGAVEKEITDGTGVSSTLKLGTTSASFVGTLDLTGATVTGLPDVDTTYTIGSVQDGLNADIKLTDQLGNQSKVTLVAGSNITLSNSGNDLTINAAADTDTTYSIDSVQDGANADIKLVDQLGNTTKVTLIAGTNITLSNSGNDLTIDAAGGAAGLVSGVGADSMISDASLTTTPASALMTRGIALGDNGRAGIYANQVDGIAIGTNALSEASRSIAIGNDAYGQSADEIAIGTGAHSRLGDGIAIGRSAYAGNTGNIALGKLANCDYQYTGAMALGTDTVVAANGGVALGASVTADKIDTVSMKALDLQTASTPTAGGIIMTDAGSTERRLNITAAGALQIDSTPVGGGGGGSEANEGQAITPCLATNVYSIPWILSGYSQTGGKNMTANTVQYIPFYAKAGEAISDFRFDLQTAQAAATMDVGLYKGYVSTATGFKTVMPEFVATIASAVDVSTTGTKNFTGLNISLPADAEGGLYWIGFISDTDLVALKIWTNWVAAERIIYNDIYRGTGVEKAAGSFALPTGQIDLSSGVDPTTDLPVDFQWRYKS